MTRRRSAFTLVELLVVIAIIGTLVSLLLPAVQSAREAARRTQCSNRQRQFALSLLNLEGARKRFPGYSNRVGPTVDSPIATWIVPIMPYIEQQAIYDRWSDGFPTTIYWELTVCPSDAAADRSSPWLSFGANCGTPDQWAYRTDRNNGDGAANGIFHDNWNPSLGTTIEQRESHRRDVGMDYIGQGDGSTGTLLLSENVNAFQWGPYEDSAAVEALTGITWNPLQLSAPQPFRLPNKGADEVEILQNRIAWYPFAPDGGSTSPEVSHDPARPSSNHPGLWQAAFCDGRVMNLADGIEYKVYCQLMTPKSAQSLMPPEWKTYILNDRDYQ